MAIPRNRKNNTRWKVHSTTRRNHANVEDVRPTASIRFKNEGLVEDNPNKIGCQFCGMTNERGKDDRCLACNKRRWWASDRVHNSPRK